MRFYKASTNTGTHTGSLWDSTGTRLATVTFTNETASGWQSANFPSYVPVSAGTTYTISYSAPNGHYSATSSYWSYRGRSSAPMAVAGGFGSVPAGVYSTTPGQYPTSSYNQANYFVDANFVTTDNSPLAATGQWPLPGSSSVPQSTTIGAVFSKPVTPASIVFTVKDSLGNTVAGTTSYAATTRTATFTPTSALNGFVVYSVALTATDTTGLVLSSGKTWSFTTVKPAPPVGTCPCGLFTDATVPTTLQVADSPVTLGLRFSSSAAGTVTGMRFYKNAANTGTHVGTLWGADGTKLASATFTGESTSGWQTVTFSTPVAITANTDYLVSYRSTTGNYSVTAGDFSGSGITRGVLTAGYNTGAYNYTDAFPGSRSTSNYMVDVVFTKAAAPIAVVSQTPASAAVDIPVTSPISIGFSVPLASGYNVAVTSAGTSIAGTTALSSDGTTLTFTPSQALPAGATISVSVSGIVSVEGATLGTQSWSFSTKAPAQTSYTLFGSELPASTATNDASAVELGVTFTPSQDGTVSAIRFFKSATNTGTHTGSLWSAAGTRLATVTFTNETASGWQTASLSTPVALSAGQTYLVSYFAPTGNYSYTQNYFTVAKTSGPLTAGVSTNGRYLYSSTGGFPTYSYAATNYFVDVVFTPTGTSGSGGSGGSSSTPTSTPDTDADTHTVALAEPGCRSLDLP